MKKVVVELYRFSELAVSVQEELLYHDAIEFAIDPEVLRQRYEALGEIFTADGMMLTRDYEPASRSVTEIQTMIARAKNIIEAIQREYDIESSYIHPDLGRLQWMRDIIDVARVRERTMEWAAGLRDNM